MRGLLPRLLLPAAGRTAARVLVVVVVRVVFRANLKALLTAGGAAEFLRQPLGWKRGGANQSAAKVLTVKTVVMVGVVAVVAAVVVGKTAVQEAKVSRKGGKRKICCFCCVNRQSEQKRVCCRNKNSKNSNSNRNRRSENPKAAIPRMMVAVAVV